MSQGSLYGLKPRFVASLDGITALLARLGVSPNTVTLSAIPFAGLAAVAIVTGSTYPLLWLLVPASALALMAANAIDGALARSTGRSSLLGAVLNEFVDRICDLLLLGSLYVVAPVWVATTALVATLVSEIVALVGWGAIGVRGLVGITGKPDRALILSIAAVAASIFGTSAFGLGAIAITLGASLTTAQRATWLITAASEENEGNRDVC